MNNRDELRDLWTSQLPLVETKGEDIMTLVQKKIRKFDRMIAIRNLRECIASVVVAAVFGWQALRADDWLTRTGTLVVAVGSLWIVYYLLRHGRTSVGVDLSQSVLGCARVLVQRYDDQIRLLKTVKYWYLLPMYAGLLIVSAGQVAQGIKAGGIRWPVFAGPVFYTAVFAVFWWLNEVHSVGRLQHERAKLLSSIEGES
jgi:hypothetical protein